jgi:hypothetical protein
MKVLLSRNLKLFISIFVLLNISTATASSQSKQQSWKFKVLLNDKPIGFHEVRIETENNRKTVFTQADFDVRFMYIPVYSYNHETREVWQDGCLLNITSATDDNGDNYFINSQKKEQEFALQTQDGNRSLHGCVRSFAYWDFNMLKSKQLLNTQTGEYQQVSITDMGNDSLSLDQGEIDARHFRLKCENMTIDLWYTMDMRWLALESVTESGAVLRYLPEQFSHTTQEASL